MQRLLPSVLPFLALCLCFAPACKDEPAGDGKADKQPEQNSGDAPVAAGTDAKAPGEDPAQPVDPTAGAAAGAAEAGAAEAGAAEAGAVEAGAAEAGAAEAGAAEAGAAEAGAEPAEDVVPGLFETAKNLDTDDEAAKKALADALAAGAGKIDAAKVANERGEKLMADGEGERAAAFFQWAADTHTVYAEPVYNLATLAAYAGDLEIAKGHLQELQKRGNKKLMKKVGVDPAFAPLHDDPDIRKIYEQ